MTINEALEVLRKQSNCWEKITECSANCEECECHVDASDLVEAVKTVLDNFPTQMSETSGRDISVITNDSSAINIKLPKFKPGSKFLLEIGEKRIGLDEYSIVGTDLYVWGSLLEKLTPYESVQAEQKWILCSKKMPEERGWYLGIFKEPDTGWVNPIPFICDYVGRETKITTKDFWILRENLDGNPYYRNLECVAWMPLPESYRGDTDE